MPFSLLLYQFEIFHMKVLKKKVVKIRSSFSDERKTKTNLLVC